MKRHNRKDIMQRIGDRLVIASVSGGKDSTAMCLYLRELEIPYQAVNMDTGWEHADTDHYVREVLPAYIGPITTIKAEIKVKPEAVPHVERIEAMLGRESSMVRLVLNRGMFPSRIRRFCTQGLKIFAMRDYLDGLDVEPINCTGVRAAESRAREKLPEWEDWSAGDCEQWRPLIHWSDQDVVDIHKRHSVPPNPLYLSGAHRVGCWPCIYARKSEIRHMAEIDPGRVKVVEALETAVQELAAVRYAKTGDTFESKGYGRPSWFQARTGERDPETGKTKYPCWPIRKVVEWAKTKHGGRQFEMFAPPAREWGCMRWGVCDTGDGQGAVRAEPRLTVIQGGE